MLSHFSIITKVFGPHGAWKGRRIGGIEARVSGRRSTAVIAPMRHGSRQAPASRRWSGNQDGGAAGGPRFQCPMRVGGLLELKHLPRLADDLARQHQPEQLIGHLQ